MHSKHSDRKSNCKYQTKMNFMKKNVFTFAFVLGVLFMNPVYGQVGIGTMNPNKSAALDVVSDNLGMLVPRMSQADRDNIISPADGLLIYNNDEDCFNYYSVSEEGWQSVCGKMGKATIDNVYCNEIKVFGNYIQGVATTANERIVIPVEVTKAGSYDATVVAMFDENTSNGYTFTASGIFLYTGKQTITLTAQGTPTNEHFNPTPPPVAGDMLKITINGTDFNTCSDFIIPVVPATADYDVSCGSAKIFGTYTMLPDQTNSDDATHYIEVNVNVNDLGLGNSASGWSAETNKVSGVQFKGSGKFNLTGNQTVRLYAVAGTKPTTLEAITLTMTFQTKNGEVGCQVNLRAAYTPKKIAAFGDQSTYGYSLYTGASRKFIGSPYNFGSLENSTVKMVTNFTPAAGYEKAGAFAYRNFGSEVNSTSSWNTIINDKVDIVVIAYPATAVTATGAASIMKYLNAGGIVIHFSEANPATIINAVFGLPSGTVAETTGGAARTALANYTDPILNGPFQPEGLKTLGGLDICGDSEPYLHYVTGLPPTGILVYGYNTSAPTTTGSRVSAFRATGQRYFYFGDGGYLTNDDNGTWLSIVTEPFATTNDTLKDGQYRPAMRPVTTGNFPNGAYNSFFFGNLLAWAIDEAQFYGINSGQ